MTSQSDSREPVEAPESAFGALLAAARAGRRPALDELCRRFYPEVQAQVHAALARDFRGARPWLSTLLSTGDVVHDVFLGVVRNIGSFRGASRLEFVGYLARLTHNRLVDMIRFHEAGRRDARRVQGDPVGLDLPNGPGPAEELIDAEDVARTHAIVAALPERDRALLHGRMEEGASFESLARTLGYASADSARKCLRAIQARLLARLRRRRP